MSEWKRVEKITNIKLTVDGGQESSSIYGNEKNCVAFLVTFNGSSDEYPEIDLRDVDVGPYISLVDFETGDSLPLEMMPTDRNGSFYSRTQGKYCNSPKLTKISTTSPESDRRASIIYFVYGKCKAPMKQFISVKIALYNGNVFSTTRDGDDPHRVEFSLMRPIQYSTLDFEPIKWTEVPLKEKPLFECIQTVAFVRLKKEFERGWINHKFEKFSKYEGELVYAARITQDDKKTGKFLYMYYLCPIGRQNSHELKLGDATIEFEYNQEPNELCITRLSLSRTTIDDSENFADQGLFTLYDKYGNQGVFKLKFKGVDYPTIVTQNI